MIPQVFHRIWLGSKPRPPMFDEFWDGFHDLHPKWSFFTWTDADDYSWLVNEELFRTRSTPSGQSDVLRIELLERFGGVYLDCDMEPLRPFDGLLADGGVFTSSQGMPYYAPVGDGWENRGVMLETAVLAAALPFAAWEYPDQSMAWGAFGSRQAHPAIKALRGALPRWVAEHPNSPPNEQTGPMFLTHVWRDRPDVRVLPTVTFYPVSWYDRDKVRGPYPPEAYAVHHWAHSWAPEDPLSEDTRELALRYRDAEPL